MFSRRTLVRIAPVLALIVTAGCGGGGGGSSVMPGTAASNFPVATPSQTTAPAQTAMVQVAIRPGSTASSTARWPKYVPASTASAVIQASLPNGTTMTTTLACAQTCSGTAQAPVGNDTFVISLYDGTNGTGNLLARGTTVQAVSAGTPNSVSMVLDGVVAALSVSLSSSVVVGSASTIVVNVSAKDASGSTIIGQYISPVSMAAADPALTITPSSVSDSSTQVTVRYNGSTSFNGATLGASTGSVNASANVQAIQPNRSLPTETAMAADAVVDSIGVNTHFNYDQTPYYTAYPAVSRMLIASGIRHIREGGGWGSPQWYYDRLNALASSGIRSGLYIPYGESDANILANYQAVPNVEFIEGPNEYDTSGDPNWVANIQTTQQHIYALKSQLGNLPVLGPSCAQPQPCALAIGNLSSALDTGNVHDYTECGYNPGGNGWGGYNPPYGTYGGRSYVFNVASIVSGSKPVYATEQGYDDNPSGQCTVPDPVIAKYDTRMVFERLLVGYTRSYFYQFSDQPNDAVYGKYGMIDAGQNPKPQYTALKSMIGLLSDPGAPIVPGALGYSMTGSNSSVHHALMQKRDGSFILALWQEVASYDPKSHSQLSVSPQVVSISLTPGEGVTQYNYAADGTLSSSILNGNNGSYNVSVGDSITFLRIAAPSTQAKLRRT